MKRVGLKDKFSLNAQKIFYFVERFLYTIFLIRFSNEKITVNLTGNFLKLKKKHKFAQMMIFYLIVFFL